MDAVLTIIAWAFGLGMAVIAFIAGLFVAMLGLCLAVLVVVALAKGIGEVSSGLREKVDRTKSAWTLWRVGQRVQTSARKENTARHKRTAANTRPGERQEH